MHRHLGLIDRYLLVVQDFLRIEAMTCQREIEYSELVAKHAPLLATAIKFVGNPATRNGGTLGGSIVFADPNADAGPAYIRSCYA